MAKKSKNIKLKPCPFCGRRDAFVLVHDDEGNVHGKLGCAYEGNPWSGLAYGLHHEGWGECILCTDISPMGGVLFDTAEDAVEAWDKLCEKGGNAADAEIEDSI